MSRLAGGDREREGLECCRRSRVATADANYF